MQFRCASHLGSRHKWTSQSSITNQWQLCNQPARRCVLENTAFRPRVDAHLSFRLYATRTVTGSVKSGESLYDVLKVPSSASLEQIKLAYRHFARKFHPDLFQPGPDQLEADAQLRKANNAYEVLSDAVQRAEYDVRWKFAQEAQSAYASATRPGAEDPVKAAQFAAQMAAAQEALTRAAQARSLARTARRQAEALRKRAREVAVPRQQSGAPHEGRQQQHETSFSAAKPPNSSSSSSSSSRSGMKNKAQRGGPGSPDDHHTSNAEEAGHIDSREHRRRERQAARVARRQATEARARARWAEFQAEGLQDRVRQALFEQQQQQQKWQQQQQQGNQAAKHGLTHAEQRRQKREAARRAAAAAAAAAQHGRGQGWQWPGRDIDVDRKVE